MSFDAKLYLEQYNIRDELERALSLSVKQCTIKVSPGLHYGSHAYTFADGSIIVNLNEEYEAYDSSYMDKFIWSQPSQLVPIQDKKVKIPFMWEYIGNETSRAKVIGGWLVCNQHYSPCFVPDPEHAWEVE